MSYRMVIGAVGAVSLALPVTAQEKEQELFATPDAGAGIAEPWTATQSTDAASPELVPLEAPPQNTPQPTAATGTPTAETPAVAPEDDDLAMSKMSLEDLLNLKVTVASREEESANEAPSLVTVFTREDIRRLGVRTVEQLLNFVPGFQSNPDEHEHFMRVDVRGRTEAAEAVLMLVDGQRVNELYFGGMNALSHGTPTENIEQVEIIRGPGSALYGANAFLGIISIKTNRSHNDVTVGAGDMNRRYASINLAKTFGELKLASFAKFYSDEGFAYSNVTDTAGRTATGYDPTRTVDSSVSLEYRGLYLRTRYLNRSGEGMSCCSSYGRFTNRTMTSQVTVQVGYQAALTKDIDLDAFAAFQRDDYFAMYPVSFLPGTPPSLSGFLWRAWSLSPNADLQWRLLSLPWIEGTLMAGGTYAHNRLTDFKELSNQDPATHDFLGELYEVDTGQFGDPSKAGKRHVVAGYLQAKAELWSRVTLTVGARYDWYNDFGKSINPRASIVWATPIKSHLKLAYGKAFRAPTIYEAGVSRPGLKPETVQTLEAGYVQQVASFAQLGADFFYQRQDDLIYYDRGATVNAGSFTTKGIELELRSREVYGASALGTYAHLFRQAGDPGDASQDFGSVALNYSRTPIHVNVNATIHGGLTQSTSDYYGGPPTRFFDRTTHALLNVRLQADIVNGLRAFGTINNVLDYRFQPAGLDTMYFVRGRTFLLGLSAEL